MKLLSKLKATLIAAVMGLMILFGTIFFDLDLFERLVGFFKATESYELDEIVLVFFLITIGITIDLFQVKKERKREQEIQKQRHRILKSTMTTVHDIVNNFLNSLQLFRMEAEKSRALKQDLLNVFDSLVKDTSDKLKTLGDLEIPHEKHIGSGIYVIDLDTSSTKKNSISKETRGEE